MPSPTEQRHADRDGRTERNLAATPTRQHDLRLTRPVMIECSSTGHGDPRMLLDRTADLYREVRRKPSTARRAESLPDVRGPQRPGGRLGDLPSPGAVQFEAGHQPPKRHESISRLHATQGRSEPPGIPGRFTAHTRSRSSTQCAATSLLVQLGQGVPRLTSETPGAAAIRRRRSFTSSALA